MAKLEPYKGYTAEAEIDIRDGILAGRVIGLRDIIHFEGDTVTELTTAFHAAVDAYLAWCTESGNPPEKPFSGKVLVRMDPNLHRQLALRADQDDTSINAIVVKAVEELLGSSGSNRSRRSSKDSTPTLAR